MSVEENFYKGKNGINWTGSTMFTQGLVMDLIQDPGKDKWHLVLVNTDTEVLAVVKNWLKDTDS